MKKRRRRYLPPRGPRPATDWERMKARRLADRYHVPVTETLRVIRGDVGLDEVLQEQEAREKTRTLIEEGLLPHLAGQVARGNIDMETAKIRSDLLKAQGRSFRYSRLNKYRPGDEIGLYIFDYGLLTGRVEDNAPYDIDVTPEGKDVPVMVKKHDIKLHFSPDLSDKILSGINKDPRVADMELGATVDLNERYRPVPEEALAWLTMPLPVKFVLRDGDVIVGRVKFCSFFEVEVELDSGHRVSIMTHALLKQQSPSFVMDA